MNYLPESRQAPLRVHGGSAPTPSVRPCHRAWGLGVGCTRVPGHFGEKRNVIVKVSAQPDKRNREWHGARISENDSFVKRREN